MSAAPFGFLASGLMAVITLPAAFLLARLCLKLLLRLIVTAETVARRPL